MNGPMWSKKGLLLTFSSFFMCFGGCDCDKHRSEAPAANKPPSESVRAPEKPKQQLVPQVKVVDWCREHGVPESICTRCNSALIADFKKKGDWCKEHDLPESQCVQCHPELEAKFKAMAPKDRG